MIDEKELAAMADKMPAHKPRASSASAPLPLPKQLPLIDHRINGTVISQQARDGYINATALCKKAGKQFFDYSRLSTTKAFVSALATETGIPVSLLIQTVKGGINPKLQGTWVHPQVAIHLAQWLSPNFAVLVSKWVFDWMRGSVSGYMPVHVQRYMKNRRKIPPDHFSMLNEIYLNLVAPLEDAGYTMPDSMMPDISMGLMFSRFLRRNGLKPENFPTYQHEFADKSRPTVAARLYPLKYLESFRQFFNKEWLPKQAKAYFQKKSPEALSYLHLIEYLPESTDNRARLR